MLTTCGEETEPRSRDRSACNEVRGQRRTHTATALASYSTAARDEKAGVSRA